MQCRNYMEQYSRTKSIREINKNRNSYKLLTQHSKLLSTNNLKLPEKKLADNYQSNQPPRKSSLHKEKLKDPITHQSNIPKQHPLHASHKPNRDSSTNIRQNSCVKDIGSSKMRIKTSVGQHSTKSISSNEKMLARIPTASSHKKKNSLKNGICEKLVNHSISINSICHTKSKPHLESINETQAHTQYNTAKGGNLEDIYLRMKQILCEHERRQSKWAEQKNGYVNKIKELENELKRMKSKGSQKKLQKNVESNQQPILHSFRKS